MLWRKLFRELMENKGPYIACIIVVSIGLTIFSSFSMVMDILYMSRENFYTNQNFADGFAELQAMPYSQVAKLRNVPGIKDVQGRLVKDVQVLFPDRQKNVYLRLVSVEPETENGINHPMLVQGMPLDSSKMNIWVDNKFFEANGLALNQEIEIVAQGKKKALTVVGEGRSPEFIYALRNNSDLYPSPETFGIAFVPLEMMHTLFPENNSVNNVVFTLKPGADYSQVEQDLRPELEPYGLKSIYPRKDQTSNLLLDGEMKGLQSMAKTLPAVFLGVAAMILYIMLKRMVEQQRGQIGILKAFGYSSREIMLHYMCYPLTVGAIGGLLGGVFGNALAFPYAKLYQQFFNMPGLTGSVSPYYLLLSLGLAILVSGIAGYQGCRGVMTLEPAEAMRPAHPTGTVKTLVERIAVFWSLLTVQGKMAVRNVFRNQRRSVFVFIGIMFSFALIGLTWSMKDLTEKALFDQYEKVETYDVKVVLAAPKDSEKVAAELNRFPGVKKVEPLAEIPVTLKNQWREKDAMLLGLPQNSTLYHIMDKADNPVNPPKNGVLLSERLAELLDAEAGTELTLDSVMLPDEDEEKQVRVAGVIPQYLGVNAFADISETSRLLEEKRLTTSAMVDIDPGQAVALQEKYRETPVVAGINDQNEMLSQLKEMMASYMWMIFIMAAFGIVTAFAVIYNSSIITLSERARELASMMVLGMTPREVLSVITFEQWFIGVFGMTAGIPVTKLMLVAMAGSMSNDVYTIPATMTWLSALAAFAVTTVSIWFAQRVAAKRIEGLSLVEVLKSVE